MKVLFVDDNELNRILMHDMLEILFEDMEIVICESANDVLNEDLESFDIILSDIDMPVMNGFELYDELKNNRNFNKPIIAVTALAVKGDKERILMHGFNDYISKPIDIVFLEDTINKYI